MGTWGGLYWHIVTDGSTYGSALNLVNGLFSNGSDHQLRVDVSGDTYSAFLDGSLTPATTLTTTSFGSGRVALYDDYYNSDSGGQTFDNISIVPEPSTWAMLAGGLGSLLLFHRRR